MSENITNRRIFLKRYGTVASGLILVPTIIPACVRGKNGNVAPSDRINVAFIGAGNQAFNDARDFMDDERVQITAVCDVNKESYGYWDGVIGGREPLIAMIEKGYSKKNGKKFSGIKGYEDFRDVIALKEIDAVEVVVPDHWHSIPVLMAAAAGKDIYCQKPLSLTIPEGRAMSNASKKYKIVFQTGSQQRSNSNFHRVCELVRNGRIGELKTIRCGLPSGTPDYGKTGNQTETVPVPEGFNYEMWLGPAPDAPYCPARTHVNFRWVLDYSGGQLTDWGGHHPDIAQWGMNTEQTGPVKIQNAKATWAKHPVWNTATDFYFEAIYANGLKLIISSNEEKGGVKFEGTEGWVWADRGGHGASTPTILNSIIKPDEIQLYKSENHFRNFIDCVYSREETIAPAEIAHRSITIAHLGNIAMKLNQDLEWDPVTEKILNNETANNMLARPMREPWASVYKEYLV
ncbi:MAG: Gfo/Idh/MocA family oxidoreductase [Draconibacterium sp.]|nr:Gfo/Idh/MocA family oxidoreductase [Draconibacterium sp.]